MKYWVTVAGRSIEVEVEGDQVRVAGVEHVASLEPVAGTPLSIMTLNGRAQVLGVSGEGRGLWSVSVSGQRFDAEVLDERTRHIRSLTGNGAAKAAGGVLKAPMPGLVLRLQVESGQRVSAGTPLLVLEAMKMENQLRAPVDGVIGEIRVAPGAAVEKGQVLITLTASSGST